MTAARLTGKSWGIDNIRVAEYPGAMAIHTSDEVAKNIENVLLDRVIAGLTQRPGSGGVSTDAIAVSSRKPVYSGTMEQLTRYFGDHDWTDGLAIVPPTPERVEQFLAYTQRGADDELAVLPPARLRATPRNVAVNAVMAGCEPRHMPIIVAAVEALADEGFNLNNMGSSSALLPYGGIL